MKPGQKVRCMNGDFHPQIIRGGMFEFFPVKNEVYTIREIRPFNAEGGILLMEIHNKPVYFPHYDGFMEPAFAQDRFKVCGEEFTEDDRVEISIKTRNIIQSN